LGGFGDYDVLFSSIWRPEGAMAGVTHTQRAVDETDRRQRDDGGVGLPPLPGSTSSMIGREVLSRPSADHRRGRGDAGAPAARSPL